MVRQYDPLSPEQKLESWRLLELIRAFRTQKEPLEEDDFVLLGRIAEAKSDLHDVCRALERGCGLEYAVIIFTWIRQPPAGNATPPPFRGWGLFAFSLERS